MGQEEDMAKATEDRMGRGYGQGDKGQDQEENVAKATEDGSINSNACLTSGNKTFAQLPLYCMSFA